MTKFVLPKNLTPVITDKHRVVLAYGEVTGHAHAFYTPEAVELLRSKDVEETRTFLKVKETASLSHEEHTAHEIKEGIGEVTIQREWGLDGLRRVAD